MAAAKKRTTDEADAVVSEDTAATPAAGGPADTDAVIAPVDAVPPTGSTYQPAPDLPADTVAQIEVRD
jgi:hypothetical protein